MYNTINKNYRMSFAFGNNTFHQKYSKRVVSIMVNEPAFSVMFIPHYNTDKYPFPPFKYNLEYEGEKFYNSDKRRILGFLEGDIIFFEYNEKKNQIFKLEFEYKSWDERISKSHILIYCLETETYNFLIKSLRKDFYYCPQSHQSTVNGAWKREYTKSNNAIQFIDSKLMEFKDLLPKVVVESLELDCHKS